MLESLMSPIASKPSETIDYINVVSELLEAGYSVKAIAKEYGLPLDRVYKMIHVGRLEGKVHRLIEEGRMSLTAAWMFSRLAPKHQEILLLQSEEDLENGGKGKITKRLITSLEQS